MKLCTVEGCEKPHYAKTWCHTHYCRMLRTGSLEKQPRRSGGDKPQSEPKHGTKYAYQIRGCRCEPCVQANRDYTNDLAAKNPASHRASKRKSRYGITDQTYTAMLAEQGCVCAICGERQVEQVLVVDHCHDSSKVRGLLCRNCNSALGMFKDDPDRLLAAAAYLLQHTDVLGAIK